MLDLAFLIVGIYVFKNAFNGIYKETACNAAVVLGVLAAIVGCLMAHSRDDATFALLNIIVAFMAFATPHAARHLVKLYNDKQADIYEQYEKERLSRMRNPAEELKTVYTDDNFDDEELRFGKGGYTDPKL